MDIIIKIFIRLHTMAKITIEPIAVSIEHELSQLALESNYIQNLVDQFQSILPNVVIKLRENSDLFKSQLFDPKGVRELYKLYDTIKPRLNQLSYTTYQDTLVSIPEGFKGDLMEYLKVLAALTNTIYKDTNSLLSDYNFMLSDFITNKDAKHSNSSLDAIYQRSKKQRETYAKAIDDYFTAKSDQSKARLKTILNRFTEVKTLNDLAINLERLQNPKQLQMIADGVDKSVQLLSIIRDQLEKDNLQYVSGVSANSIAQGAYELGQMIEFVSIFNFKCNQAITAVKNTMEVIQKLIEK